MKAARLLRRGLHALAGHAPECKPTAALSLPENLRGNGDIVACDGSYRIRDNHAQWAFITNAGWHKTGIVQWDRAHINRMELRAIAEALRIYPDGHRVWVQSDSSEARAWARRILAYPVPRREWPSWMTSREWHLLRAAKERGVYATIVAVPSKQTPLHNIADRLARYGAESLEEAA